LADIGLWGRERLFKPALPSALPLDRIEFDQHPRQFRPARGHFPITLLSVHLSGANLGIQLLPGQNAHVLMACYLTPQILDRFRCFPEQRLIPRDRMPCEPLLYQPDNRPLFAPNGLKASFVVRLAVYDMALAKHLHDHLFKIVVQGPCPPRTIFLVCFPEALFRWDGGSPCQDYLDLLKDVWKVPIVGSMLDHPQHGITARFYPPSRRGQLRWRMYLIWQHADQMLRAPPSAADTVAPSVPAPSLPNSCHSTASSLSNDSLTSRIL